MCTLWCDYVANSPDCDMCTILWEYVKLWWPKAIWSLSDSNKKFIIVWLYEIWPIHVINYFVAAIWDIWRDKRMYWLHFRVDKWYIHRAMHWPHLRVDKWCIYPKWYIDPHIVVDKGHVHRLAVVMVMHWPHHGVTSGAFATTIFWPHLRVDKWDICLAMSWLHLGVDKWDIFLVTS